MSLTPDYVDRQLFATISTIIVGFFFVLSPLSGQKA